MADLVALCQRGEAGRWWYEEAEVAIHQVGGDDWQMLAKLLAVLSPQADVRQNVGWAVTALRDWRDNGRKGYEYGLPMVGRFTAVAKRTNAVMNGLPLTGQKVTSFYRALTGDTEAVAIDQFVASALGWTVTKTITQFRYKLGVTVVREVAHTQLGWSPRQAQAALWAAAPRKRSGGSMAKELERSQGLLLQGRLEVSPMRGPRQNWEVE